MAETHRQISKREFLRHIALLSVPLALAACSGHGNQPPPPPAHIAPAVLPLPTPTENAHLKSLIAKGGSMRTPSDIQMLNETYPGVDLRYAENSSVAQIRAINDPTERIMATIGFLDVESSQRYSEDRGVYTCNIYALDTLRLLLGNEVIGSAFNKQTGAPSVAGLNDIDWGHPEQYYEANEFLDSNNLDLWLREYGRALGWQRVTTQHNLKAALRGGSVGVAVSSFEYVQQERAKIKAIKPYDDFTGHTAVVGFDKNSVEFFVSQATNNHRLVELQADSKDPRIFPENPKGEYSIWVHKLPEAVPID